MTHPIKAEIRRRINEAKRNPNADLDELIDDLIELRCREILGMPTEEIEKQEFVQKYKGAQ